jgi:hypothetical protein
VAHFFRASRVDLSKPLNFQANIAVAAVMAFATAFFALKSGGFERRYGDISKWLNLRPNVVDSEDLISRYGVVERSRADSVNVAALIYEAAGGLNGLFGRRKPPNLLSFVFSILDVPVRRRAVRLFTLPLAVRAFQPFAPSPTLLWLGRLRADEPFL